MKLVGLAYHEPDWHLDIATFQPVNLLVGKNASGKSRSVAAIARMAGFLSDRVKLSEHSRMSGTMVFKDDAEGLLTYSFAWEAGKIVQEFLQRGDNAPIIVREDDNAKLLDEVINPPTDKLIAHIRRDVIRYPEIEEIVKWAGNVAAISFNMLDGAHTNASLGLPLSDNFELLKMVSSLSEESKKEFYKLAEKIGYHVTNVRVVEGLPIIVYTERGIRRPLFDANLSTGMNRALSILIYLVYLRQIGYPALLVIDDLCEGLDYDRSVRLGKEVFAFCEDNNIQLLVTSNDAFLMDVVDINYWSVLQRDGVKVKVLCRDSHRELFDDFKFTGLSNFDFFSSDYIPTYFSKHPEV